MNSLATIAIPRRRPRQERSRALVEAIVEAAALILGREGRDAVTTNSVAMRAGVSIGSLYQYFPNAEAILAAVADQHMQRVSTCIASVELHDAFSLSEATRRIVGGMFAAHRLDAALHLALAADLANRQSSNASQHMLPAAQIAVVALFGSLPPAIRAEARCGDYGRAIDIVGEITHALAHAAIARPDDGDDLEAEAVRVVLAYLRAQD